VLRIRQTPVLDDQRKRLRAWQERVRDPSLTVLLVLELCTIFLAEPLVARGLPIAQSVADTLVLALVLIVVALLAQTGAQFFLFCSVWRRWVGAPSSGRSGRPARRQHPCLFGTELGVSVCSLCPGPYHVAPPSTLTFTAAPVAAHAQYCHPPPPGYGYSPPPCQAVTPGPFQGAARGAAGGAVIGAISGNAGRGAAIGAGFGAVRNAVRRGSARSAGAFY
jgi:Glycine-zipper domain